MTLYHLEYCPFCIEVRRSAEALGIELTLVDVGQDPQARAMLVERRGRGTVPVLGIPSDDGEHLMGESRDIIDHLRGLAAA
ncbi:MAG: glutaredoxin [Nannocystaceae bacterium]|nr:glutaredoxin [Nannocystaceae bacterium]